MSIGHGALASLFAASLLVGSGCSGDSNTSFTDVAGNGPGSGDAANGGTDQASSGKGSGAEQSGGASAAGSGTHAGSANAGTQSGGGSDTGGSDTGGSDSAGTDTGGTNNKAGSGSGGNGKAGAAGMAGSAGAGGSAGAAGSAGAGGASGSAGAGGSVGGTGGNGGSAGMSGGGNGGCASKPEVCDGIDNNCDNVTDPPGTCPDGCTGALYGGHTYYFCGLVDAAATALAKCTNAGMAMISIETKAENDFVAGKVKGSTWLGGSDEADEGHWLWLSSNDEFWTGGAKGGPVDGKYTNWLALQPNDNGAAGTHENCLAINPAGPVITSSGKWNDLNCSLTGSRWACESTGPAITPGGP